jgi:predicted permease
MGWKRFFRRNWWDDERARELESYLDIETDENLARGMTADEARFAAQRKLGNATRIREDIYRMNSLSLLETSWQDLRFGLRLIRRNPGFAALAMLTLAVGIGAVTVIYSVIQNVLLDPFPYTDSRRLVDVLVYDTTRPAGVFRGPLPAPEFLDYQEQSDVFEDVVGTSQSQVMYTSREGAQQLDVARVTPNLFTFLGVAPLLGRAAGAEDVRPGAPAVTVLSHKLWVAQFNADPGVLGRSLLLNGAPYIVIGVMPPRFTWHVADLWLPMTLDRHAPPAAAPSTATSTSTTATSTATPFRPWFQARLKPGVSLAQAEAQLDAIAARRAQANPGDYPKQFRIGVIPVIDFVVGRFRGVLYTLFAAVGLLLVIACGNVANMLLARSTAREREMTVRAALGAGRGRLVRQMFVESLLLSLGGAAAGALLAYGGLQAVIYFMPQENVPWETRLTLDSRVLLFCLGTAAVAALLFGLLPALHGARRELMVGMKDAGKGTSGGFRHGRVRNGLVIAEIALCLVLLLGAGLLMRSFIALVSVDPGIDAARLVVARVAFAPGEYATGAAKHAYYTRAIARLAALPGVTAVAESSNLPPFEGGSHDIEIPGTAPVERRTTDAQFIGRGYFETVDLPLLRGRDLTAADVEGARQVAVVSDTFVRRYFDGEDPLGRTFVLPELRRAPQPIANPVFEIVGVVRDVKNRGLREAPAPHVYLPVTVAGWVRPAILVRIAGEAAPAVNAVRREVAAVDAGVALRSVDTVEDIQRRLYAQPRFSLIILMAFAGIGLLLVTIGVYGVLAYTVSCQTQELAIRMALGGDRRHVLGIVLRLGARLLATGLAAGLLASLATNTLLARQFTGQLLNTSPRDPLILATAVAVIALTGLAACLIPALRATRVDPIVALRQE